MTECSSAPHHRSLKEIDEEESNFLKQFLFQSTPDLQPLAPMKPVSSTDKPTLPEISGFHTFPRVSSSFSSSSPEDELIRFSDVRYQTYLEELEKDLDPENPVTPRVPLSFTVSEVLRMRARITPKRVAFSTHSSNGDIKDKITYQQLHSKAKCLALALQKRNAGGHCAVLLFDPSVDYVVALMGCLYAQVIPIPIQPPKYGTNLATRLRELAHIIEHSQATVGITTLENRIMLGVFSRLFQTIPIKNLDWLETSLPIRFSWNSIDVDRIQAFGEVQRESLMIVDYQSQRYENGELKIFLRTFTHKDVLDLAHRLRFQIKRIASKPRVIIPCTDHKQCLDCIFLPIMIGCEGAFTPTGSITALAKPSRVCFGDNFF
eukprot:c2694_g1_i2.p1 GENE.c2694_g1_i2~~c2694_g1_i2.p1  ORF type:complete len:391 (+),score=50.12 c2694_g1_i2:47-1174(+)